MGFPERIITGRKVSTGEEKNEQKFLEKCFVGQYLAQLEQLMKIRKFAEEMMSNLAEDLEKTSERLDRVRGRMEHLRDVECPRIENLCWNFSPASFVRTASDVYVYRNNIPKGAMFHRSQNEDHVKRRRQPAQEVTKLKNLDKFWTCFEVKVWNNDDLKIAPATDELRCLEKFTNPRFFYNQWMKQEAEKHTQREKRESKILLEREEDRRKYAAEEKRLFPILSGELVAIEKHFKNDLGEEVTRIVGNEQDIKEYKLQLAQNKKIRQKINYGRNTEIDKEELEKARAKEEAYELTEPKVEEPKKEEFKKLDTPGALSTFNFAVDTCTPPLEPQNAKKSVAMRDPGKSKPRLPSRVGIETIPLNQLAAPPNIRKYDDDGEYAVRFEGLKPDSGMQSSVQHRRASMKVLENIRKGSISDVNRTSSRQMNQMKEDKKDSASVFMNLRQRPMLEEESDTDESSWNEMLQKHIRSPLDLNEPEILKPHLAHNFALMEDLEGNGTQD